jgi:hypothetical protein
MGAISRCVATLRGEQCFITVNGPSEAMTYRSFVRRDAYSAREDRSASALVGGMGAAREKLILVGRLDGSRRVTEQAAESSFVYVGEHHQS